MDTLWERNLHLFRSRDKRITSGLQQLRDLLVLVTLAGSHGFARAMVLKREI